VTVPGEAGTRRILVDTTPEMRIQMLRAGIGRIEAVLVTHTHADHIFGMDDIRQFNFKHGMDMPIYGTPETLGHLRSIFSYCFRETQAGGGKPRLVLTPIEPYVPFELLGLTITPLVVMHGEMPVITYKFGEHFAYVTDVSEIPAATRPHLRGVDTVVVGTVRYEPHPTHFHYDQALAEVAALGARRAYLTHLSHYFGHAEVSAKLPAGVALAYDGLTIDIAA